MAVKIRLKRMGKIRAPFYRVVVMDSRTKRDGRAIEEIGLYHPTREPSVIEIDSERALYWLGVGAQPTEQVAALLKVTGDWQKHKGLPGTEGTLKTAPPPVDKKAAYEAAMAAAGKADEDQARRGPAAPRKKAESAPAAETSEPAPAQAPVTQADATPDATSEADATPSADATPGPSEAGAPETPPTQADATPDAAGEADAAPSADATPEPAEDAPVTQADATPDADVSPEPAEAAPADAPVTEADATPDAGAAPAADPEA